MQCRSFGELLSESDHVTAPAAMKPAAALVNSSRGRVVDTGALAGRGDRYGPDSTRPTRSPSRPTTRRLFHRPPHRQRRRVHPRRDGRADGGWDLLAAMAGRPLPHCVNAEAYPL